MAGRLLLCLVFLCLVTNYSQCKRFSSSRSRGSSSSSWGRGWGSSSGSSKPSHSSSSSWFGSGSSAPKYPSSSSGLSGFGSSAPKYPSSSSGLSGFGSSAPKYPSSSSGLSGFGSSAPKYPSSSSGLSGFGSSVPKYPSSSSGLSGFGSSAPKYPSSSSGLSGFGSSAPKYPSSSSGLSGFGSNAPKYPSSSSGLSGGGSNPKPSNGLTGFTWTQPTSVGSGSNKYPGSTGLSGSGIQKPSNNYYPTSSNTNFKPSDTHHSSNVYTTNTGYGSGHKYGSSNYGYGSGSQGYSHGFYNIPSYYTAPQHIYVTEYRNSGSRYGDLLTGLTLYNLGRSHSHYNHHYYNDDYYRTRYHTRGSTAYQKPKDEATCTLRIKENDKIEVLKIPCEIVSTFTEGSKKVATEKTSQTVCVSTYTVINNTLPKTINSSADNNHETSTPNALTTNITAVNTTLSLNGSIVNTQSKPDNASDVSLHGTTLNNNMISVINNTSLNDTISPTSERNLVDINSNSSNVSNVTTTVSNPLINGTSNITNINSTTVKPLIDVATNSTPYTISTSNVTFMNSTNCTTTTDPLTVKGPPVNASDMDCEVDIITKDSHILRSKVDCKILLQYAKMPEPKKEDNVILPDRSKLKSWLANPPWWMSLFIAL